jgi:intracellular multiplication protein IcmE
MNDDLDEEIIGPDDNLDGAPSKKGGTLGDMWRNNPLVKVGVVLVAGAIIFGAASMFGGSEEKVSPSDVGTGSEVASTPGLTEGASPAYTAAIEEQNEADLEQALQTGGSTLPVPVESQADRLQLPEEEEEASASEDPLMRWRRLQEERLTREIETQVEVEPVAVLDSEQQSEAVRKLTEAMAGQMQKILTGDEEATTFNYVQVKRYCTVDKCGGGPGGAAANQGGPGDPQQPNDGGFDELDSAGIEEDVQQEILIPAGEIEYAQLMVEANSDVPGPVLALLVSGPLSGSKLLGTFTVVDDYLTISFETIVVDGESYAISAVALDPSTTLPGMATEVDHRYFKKIVLPAAAAFIEGFAEAVSQTEETTITIDTGSDTTTSTNGDPTTEEEIANGIEEAGQEISEILEEMADDTETLVKIHAGTPIGVLFTEPVVQEET